MSGAVEVPWSTCIVMCGTMRHKKEHHASSLHSMTKLTCDIMVLRACRRPVLAPHLQLTARHSHCAKHND